MARDNSPKERQKRQLERKLARRASYDRILIVSEGSKTEPNYFKEIRSDYRLHTANIEVRSSALGTAPIQVVRYAKELFENGDRHKRIQARAFEQVYAVFDRDDHDSYFDALVLAESLNGKLKNDNKQAIKFSSIASVPCFELWLLLHFEDVFAPVHRDDVIKRLKRHIPDYVKGTTRSYFLTKERLPYAVQRSQILVGKFSARTAPEPYTAIVDLVTLLISMRQ